MFSENDERIILASWFHGEHLEDVSVIPVENFTDDYWRLAKIVRQHGTDLKRLYEAATPSVIAGVLRDYSPELYGVAIQSTMQEEMWRKLPEGATASELLDHAKKYHRNWMERPKAADLVTRYLDELGKRETQEVINTGIGIIDKRTYGIHKGQLTVVGARPSVGKSAFTLQVAFNVARKGNKVLFLPLEMTAEEITERIVLRYGKDLTSDELRTGALNADQMQSVNNVLDEIEKLRNNFKVVEGVRNLDLIHSLIHDERPDLIVIDQLSQIKTNDERASIRERFVEITRTLKAVALEEECAIWLPCQLNRDSTKGDYVTLDNLKESGSIEEDADIVVLLYNTTDAAGNSVSPTGARYVAVDIQKNRQGALGQERLEFNSARFLFKNIVNVEGFIPSSEKEEF